MFNRNISKRNSLYLLCFALILIIGFLVRFYRLDTTPAGLHFDEAQAGYNAYSILKTGKNLNGERLPLDIDYFGDRRPAMISYVTIPPIYLFGLNVFSTRLAGASFGLLMIVVVFGLTNEFFNNRKLALLSSFLTSISPMSLIFSRSTMDGVVESFFVLCGFYLLIKSIKSHQPFFLILVYVLWVFAYFSYQTSRVLIPILSLPIVFLSYLEFRPSRKMLIFAIIPILIYLIFPFGYYLRQTTGNGRFNQVSVFSYPEVQRDLDEQIREDGVVGGHVESRLFHNKIVGYLFDIGERYMMFFSPQTILFSLSQPDRYSVPHVGAVSIVEFIGFVFAISIYLLKWNRKYLRLVPLFLLITAPVPSALTFEAAPNFQRAIYMIPSWQIFSSFGLISMTALLRGNLKKVVWIIMIFVVVGQFYFYLHQFFVHQPKRFSAIASRSTEMMSVSKSLKRYVDTGKKVVISERGGPYIYYLFYNSLLPNEIKTIKSGKYYTKNFSIDSIDFVDSECVSVQNYLSLKYDNAIVGEQCLIPSFSKLEELHRRSDGSLSALSLNLDSPIYFEIVRRYKIANSLVSKQLIEKEFSSYLIKVNQSGYR